MKLYCARHFDLCPSGSKAIQMGYEPVNTDLQIDVRCFGKDGGEVVFTPKTWREMMSLRPDMEEFLKNRKDFSAQLSDGTAVKGRDTQMQGKMTLLLYLAHPYAEGRKKSFLYLADSSVRQLLKLEKAITHYGETLEKARREAEFCVRSQMDGSQYDVDCNSPFDFEQLQYEVEAYSN
jgi:hypothetical protein